MNEIIENTLMVINKTSDNYAFNKNTSYEDFSVHCNKDFDYDLTELGNSKRLKALLQDKVLWVHGLACFIVYKNNRWVKDDSGISVRAWDLLLDDLDNEIQFYTDLAVQLKEYSTMFNVELLEKKLKNNIKELKQHHKTSQKKNAIYAALELFKSQKNTSVQADQIDSKGKYLGCKNGIVNLSDGTLIENASSYLMMKSSNVNYDTKAQCPNFLAFLDKIMLGDSKKIEFLQLLAGQMLIGEDIKDKLVIFIGNGANGKSVFLDVLSELLGDYSVQSAPEMLTGRGKNQEYYLASFQGKRLMIMVETQRGDKLEETLVKMLIDSGRVSARVPCGQPFSYQPVFTPILCTNYMPYISSDPAIWRRLVIVPFEYTVPVTERDPNFKSDLLRKEGVGILNWMVQGAIKLYKNKKIEIPEVLVNSLNKYRCDFDNISHFMTESQSVFNIDYCDTGLKCRITDLRKMYEQWCKNNGYQALSTRNFKQELLKKHFEVKKSTGGHDYVYGIKIVKNGEIQELIVDSLEVDDAKHKKSKRLRDLKKAICSKDNMRLTHEDELSHEREFELIMKNEEDIVDSYFSAFKDQIGY